MSWIRVEDSFPRHHKTMELADALNEPLADAYVLRLWLWTLSSHVDGNLANVSDSIIARAVDYRGDPVTLCDALRSCGFIDDDGMVHGWEEYQGAIIRRREADRVKAAEQRAKSKKDDRVGGTVRRTIGGTVRQAVQRTNERTDERTDERNEESLSTGVDLFGQAEKPKADKPPGPLDAKIDQVLTHWRQWHATPATDIAGETAAGAERRKRIRRLLKAKIPVEQMIAAIDGALKDDWYMGRKDGSAGYRKVENILLDASRIEKLAALATGKPNAPRAEPVRAIPLAPPPPPKPKWTIETAVAAAHGFASFGPRRGKPRLVIPHGETIPEGFDTSPYEVIHTEPPKPRLQDLIPESPSEH